MLVPSQPEQLPNHNQEKPDKPRVDLKSSSLLQPAAFISGHSPLALVSCSRLCCSVPYAVTMVAQMGNSCPVTSFHLRSILFPLSLEGPLLWLT